VSAKRISAALAEAPRRAGMIANANAIIATDAQLTT